MVWVDGWVVVEGGWVLFWEGGGAAESLVISSSSHLSADACPFCLVYIHRIGSALCTNKILLLIIRAPQKSANQSDEDDTAR